MELGSPTDSLKQTQAKIQEYIDNGISLGWLLDEKARLVEIYRPVQDVKILENALTLSGENVLSGFILELQPIMSI